MAHWLKLLLHKAEDLSSISGSHSGRREQTPGSRPLPSTPALCHACTPNPSHIVGIIEPLLGNPHSGHYYIYYSKLSLHILICKPISRVRVDRFLGRGMA